MLPVKMAASTFSWAPDFIKRVQSWDAEHAPEVDISTRHALIDMAIYQRSLQFSGTLIEEVCAFFLVGVEPHGKVLFTLWHRDQAFNSSKKILSGENEQFSRWQLEPQLPLDWCTKLRGSIT